MLGWSRAQARRHEGSRHDTDKPNTPVNRKWFILLAVGDGIDASAIN
jgi:hypothetical protein